MAARRWTEEGWEKGETKKEEEVKEERKEKKEEVIEKKKAKYQKIVFEWAMQTKQRRET